jgi:patatin-related protein
VAGDPTGVTDPPDEEELRLGLVLNGGVSLAVWMGGVVCEIDRLRRAEGPYSELLGVAKSTARVDVIAGASAGGMNGALLALAIARGTSVRGVRDVWMQAGAVDALLRDPMQRDAPSLFRGDEFFLPTVIKAFSGVAIPLPGQEPATADDVDPLRLMITTTLLEGESKGYDDFFGEPIPDVDNRGLLRFQRGSQGEPRVTTDGREEWPDDFAPDGSPDRAVRRLALAARCTASFPGAFEPSFCPVFPPEGSPLDDHHPDMGPVANFSSSRWVMDGGVLVNTPFLPALDAIATLPAEQQVRRVLAYVVPSPGTVDPPQTADPTASPSLTTVIRDALTTLPRVQSIGRELTEISENNRRVLRRRYSRDALLTGLGADGLRRAAEALLPTYIEVRRRGAADDMRSLLLGRPEGSRGEAERLGVLDAALAAATPPWLPEPPTDATSWDDLALTPWRWGVAPVEHGVNTVLDLLRRAMVEPAFKPLRAELGRLRGAVHEVLAATRALQRTNDHYWRTELPPVLEGPNAIDATRTVIERWPASDDGHALLARLADVVVEAARLLAAPPDGPARDAPTQIRRLTAALAAPSLDGATREAAMRQLLALDVVQRSSGPDLAGIDQTIDLVLCSGNTGNAFDDRSSVGRKLAGLQVNHFGSFYKTSWRANDWMWGRLDGADRMARIVIDTGRLHQLAREGTSPDDLCAQLEDVCTHSGDEAIDRYLQAAFPRDAILAELRTELQADEPPGPNGLQRTHAAVRLRLQLEILREELPRVAQAAAADPTQHDTAADAHGARWAAALPEGWATRPESLIDAFKACDIGEERIAGEYGSDHFTAVSTQAVGVLGSVIHQFAPGAKPVQVAVRSVRGLTLSLYLLARGVLAGTRTDAFLVAMALALGGILVALAVIGAGVPAIFAALGAVILVAAVLLASLRRRALQALVIVTLGVIVIAASYYLSDHHRFAPWVNRLAPAVAVLLVAILAVMLGGVDLKRPHPSTSDRPPTKGRPT